MLLATAIVLCLTACNIDVLFGPDKPSTTTTTTTVAPRQARKPVFNPGPSIFTDSMSLTLAAAGTNPVIRYTLDGSEPSEISTTYSGPVTLDQSALVRARAWVQDSMPSDVAETWFVRIDLDTLLEEVQTPYEYGPVLVQSGDRTNDPFGMGEFARYGIDSATVVKDGEWYWMTNICFDGTGYSTSLSRSENLRDWEFVQWIGSYNERENMPEGTWDKYNFAGYIVCDHVWGEAPRPYRHHLTVDGVAVSTTPVYLMSYLGSNTPGYESGDTAAGLAWAESLEGPWHRLPEPILQAEEPHEFGNGGRGRIWRTQIVPREDGSFIVYYNAGQPEKIYAAVSTDLRHWTRIAPKPQLGTGSDSATGMWGSWILGNPQVVKIPGSWGDLSVMFYFTDSPLNRDGVDYGYGGIVDSLAVSADGTRWLHSFRPLNNVPDPERPFNHHLAHKPWIFKEDGTVYHFYCAVQSFGAGGFENEIKSIALASSRPEDAGASNLNWWSLP
jgi:hypothetical protein